MANIVKAPKRRAASPKAKVKSGGGVLRTDDVVAEPNTATDAAPQFIEDIAANRRLSRDSDPPKV